LILAWFCSLSFVSALPLSGQQKDKPRVRGITVRKLTVADGDQSKVTLAIEITGDKFGPTKTPVVKLINLETGAAVAATVISHDNNKITAKVQLDVAKDPVKYEFSVTVDNESAIPEGHLSDYTVEVRKEEKPEPKEVKPLEITFETFKSEEYPNLHSLLITNKNKDIKTGFSANPALMKVDIVPPGATNITVQPGSSPYQMLVTFLAPEKFDVKGVVVTVFDPTSTLGNNQPIAFSTPFKEKPQKEDPNQPKIEDISVLSMQRHSGYGTVRIKGSGFGDYERPPITGEKELLCCLNRPSNPNIADEQEDRKSDKLVVKDTEVCSLANKGKCDEMADWRRRIEERVNITLLPRNTDFRIERTQIMYVDDKVIDVYFEFSRFNYLSVPLRLENATVTVYKGAVKGTSTSDAAATFTAVLSGPQTFVATKEIGPPRDKNLEYRYAVLNQQDALKLFGEGVGKNFFVIELTVVNNAKKKMAVPLGSIQDETVWAYGDPENGEFLDEGPPTLPPLPLGAVSGYFDAYQKSKGKWAKVFNVLDGVTTLSAAMVPVIKEVGRAGLILSGGGIPALRKAIGDLSSEQLQRLTAMSWENVEEIVPGGSQSKFIYIPRAAQLFGEPLKHKKKDEYVIYRTRREVINITGLEVAGFEVTESEKKTATEQETPKP